MTNPPENPEPPIDPPVDGDMGSAVRVSPEGRNAATLRYMFAQ